MVVVVSESVSGADSSELARQQQRHGDDQVTVASATSRLSLSLVVEQSSEEVEGTLVLSWVHLEHVWVGMGGRKCEKRFFGEKWGENGVKTGRKWGENKNSKIS